MSRRPCSHEHLIAHGKNWTGSKCRPVLKVMEQLQDNHSKVPQNFCRRKPSFSDATLCAFTASPSLSGAKLHVRMTAKRMYLMTAYDTQSNQQCIFYKRKVGQLHLTLRVFLINNIVHAFIKITKGYYRTYLFTSRLPSSEKGR